MSSEPAKEIVFNSVSKNKFKYLSNFYGDVEICFIQKRFANSKMKKLFDKFKTCDSQTFKKLLQLLQPDKSGSWTEKKLNYWFDKQNEFAEPQPIRGILAKLLGNVIKNPTSSKNIKVIEKLSEKLKISKEDVIKPGKITDDNDMMECLEQKFALPEYKNLLLETKDSILHEKPIQGKGNDWTFPGKDKLGIMLMQIRNKLKNELKEDSDIPNSEPESSEDKPESEREQDNDDDNEDDNEDDNDDEDHIDHDKDNKDNDDEDEDDDDDNDDDKDNKDNDDDKDNKDNDDEDDDDNDDDKDNDDKDNDDKDEHNEDDEDDEDNEDDENDENDNNEDDEDEDDEDDEDDDFDYDDEYFQKFDKKLRNNIITDYHPEAINHNYDEVKKLITIVRDEDGIIIDPLHKTLPILTKYERARVLGQRATQLDIGGKSLINVPDNIISSYLIAEEELKQKKLPFIIKRPIPNGGFEYWDVNDLELL